MPSQMPVKVVTSKANYQCDGCCGEFPIPKGTPYGRMAAKAGGKLVTMRFCIRCVCAILNKQRYCNGDGFRVERGSLQMSKLNNRFRKMWNAYMESCQRGGEMMPEELMEELGISEVLKQQGERE